MRATGLIACIVLSGQLSIAQSLLATAGGQHNNTETLIQWSMGECFIGDFSNEDTYVTIGFQQPVLSEIVAVDGLVSMNEGSFYPNPVDHYLYINLPETVKNSFEITVTQMQGQKMEAHVENDGSRIRIDVSAWTAGIYLLKLVHKNQVFTSKVTKL